MNLLFVGDVFGEPGVDAAERYLRRVRDGMDLIVVNAENAANGRGVTAKHVKRLRDAGADVLTLGNHAFDQPGTEALLESSPTLVRALNFPPGTPGVGSVIVTAKGGRRVVVAQVMGRVFMDPLDDPFRAVDDLLDAVPTDLPVVLDVHAEATSEKKVMLHHVAGRVAVLVGTHTHVQTADETVVRGTAYITDVGMTGVQHSAIGMRFDEVHHRFVRKTPMRYVPASGPAHVSAVTVQLEGTRAVGIERICHRMTDD